MKTKSNYVVDADGDGPWAFHEEESEGEEHIYVAEGDLDKVMDEDTVMEALTSYREMRQALRDQRTNRGFYPGKGRGFKGSDGKGGGKQKVHIEQLKLRTRCNRCGDSPKAQQPLHLPRRPRALRQPRAPSW